jgi:hypothetical protein
MTRPFPVDGGSHGSTVFFDETMVEPTVVNALEM